METCPVSGASVEILLLSIPASKRIEDVSSTAGQTWSTLISAYKNMPGTQDIYWGRKIEDPGTVLLIIEWTDMQASNEADRLVLARTAQDAIPRLTSANAVLPYIPYYRVEFTSPLAAPLSAPCTEFNIAFFARTADEAERAAFATTTSAFMDAVSTHPESGRGFAGGWTVDSVLHPAMDGQKGRAFVSAVGWDEPKAHYAFNKSEVVALNKGGIAAEGVKARQVLHIYANKA